MDSTTASRNRQDVPNRSSPRQTVALAVTLVLLAPLGFGLKHAYAGPAAAWAKDYGAAIVYEVFWVLLVRLIWPRTSAIRAAAWVLAATCALETLQLWQPVWLERIRASVLGAALLGTSFDWFDFPHYVLGCLAGYGIARAFARMPSPE